MSDAWRPAAHRGQLDFEIHTRSQAQAMGVILPAEAEYLGVIYPDGESKVEVGFISLDALRVFINEMAPREVRVAPGDDHDVIAAQLSRTAGEVLH